MSSPRPPLSVSASAPPSRTSLPAPPSRLSLPPPPYSVSAPAPAMMMFCMPLPVSTWPVLAVPVRYSMFGFKVKLAAAVRTSSTPAPTASVTASSPSAK
ncbi:hypothetical protein C7I55_17565 [Sphingomonas deserti]|uniref:Uncharacterized protein n=1 Tax=Allosphingosinicella deserti TaxID=2116704 RepID=A0A2P7QMA5_9SPHN|nr:hypothetical protein C7I55_17565 [Sphingomonas deserti]